MAKKPTTTRSIESDVSKELENALDLDLTESPVSSDISVSMDDLEAQISQAADELVREDATASRPPPGSPPRISAQLTGLGIAPSTAPWTGRSSV